MAEQNSIPGAEEACWLRIAPEDYESAIYEYPPMIDLYNHQVKFVKANLAKGDLLVEVGCGTCKFCLAFLGRASRIVGVDINQGVLGYVRHNHPGAHGELVLINGNASQLNAVLRAAPQLQDNFWDHRRIVCCVMNTLGIMPAAIRQSVVSEMVKLTSNNGFFFLSVFAAKHFARCVEEFYKQVPQLCGTVQDSDIDLAAAELRVASSGYYSHWFKPQELADLVERTRVKRYRIIEVGIGLFVSGRR